MDILNERYSTSLYLSYLDLTVSPVFHSKFEGLSMGISTCLWYASSCYCG
jgi:hypothetical protein